jgi:hypothetical protein
VNCYGNFDGTITTTSVTGGTAPYYYYWVGPNGFTADQANLTGLGAGVYSLTLTDYHGCLAFSSREVYQPAELILGPEATYGPISCNGATDGSITPTNITGGTPSYHYMWSTGATTLTLSGIGVGTYTLTVSDFHGCSDVQSFTIGQPDPVTVTFNMSPVVCFNTPTGSITAEGHGGTGSTYNYSWTGPNGYLGSGATITGLYAGMYNVSVTDVNNCLGTGSIEVTQPTALVITNAVVDSVNCQGESDGSISVVVDGGTPGYYYYWEGPNAFTANTSTISGLYFGVYSLTVTDQNACALTTQYEVFEPGKLQWTGVTDSVNCYGNFDGTITTTSVTGGTAPYYYYWTGPNGYTANTPNLTGLEAGTYFVTVTDYHGCLAFSNRTVYQPDVLDISTSATITKPTCYTGSDGSITGVSISGGTTPYTYLWSNGTTTLNNYNLAAGAYTLSVTDWHGCTDAQEFIVPDQDPWDFNIEGPAQVCCNTSTINDTATYTASALTGTWSTPVSYQWGVEGGVIIGGQNTNSIQVVWSCCGTGKVYLTVTQGPNNCQLTKELPVVITPTPAPVISGPISVTANSTTTYSVVNGDPTHLYTWNVVGGVIVSGNGTSSITVEWGNYPPCGCGEVTVCESTQITPGVPGCTGCATMNITVMPNPLARSIYGFVTYKNGFSTGLNGVTVNLRNVTTNTIVATTVTGPNMNPDSLFAGYPGYYEFQIGSGMTAGSQYMLESSFNGTWGGNNATDALLIQLHIVGTVNLGLPPYGSLNLGVADVNGSNTITGLDALYVKLRTVGSISSYPAGDWKFDSPVVTIPASGSIRNDYNGLCFGDVNGSYIPTGLKELSFLSVVEDKTQTVPVDESFAYTIRTNAKAQLGAMTLFMGYDPTMFEVVDIASQNDEMKYVIEDGHVAIAWADTKPMSVQADDQLFTLTVKAKAPITEAMPIFNVKSGSEFANALGTRYDDFELKMSKVITPTGSNEFTLFNYPNPFNVETKVVYTLPEDGQVKLVLTDMYGKEIRTLVDDAQLAGTHAITLNGAELHLTAGVYLYRIEVTGANENYVRVNKLIFAR